jgi:hypothetical protein
LAQRPRPPMRSGLLPEARHLVLPKGIVSSSFPRIREVCRTIGVSFDPWQTDLNRCLLAKGEDGLLAADTAALSIARQVGKTFDIGAVEFGECIADPWTTVVWTAHHFKVARETFNELRALAKSPKLAPHLNYDDITTAAGNECIPFRNGSRIVFAARERGAIRGFTKVRRLVLDEAQILTATALADLAPTMNQARDPLIILMGTPPKPGDPSEVFSEFRTEALAGASEGVLFVEISADADADPDDREAWKRANPSYPARTPARAILRLRKLLTTEDFIREALGVWDSDSRAFVEAWLAGVDDESSISGQPALAVAMSPDNATVSLVAIGDRSDGDLHVEVIEEGHPEAAFDGKSFIERVAEVSKGSKSPVAIHPGHPAGSLLADLKAAKVRIHSVTSLEYQQASGALFKAVIAGQVHHRAPQPELDRAVRNVTRKRAGETMKWAGDGITALVAASQAHALLKAPTKAGWMVTL